MIKAYAEMIRDISGDDKKKREAHTNVIIDEADFNSWDSVVMCYLPGSEGAGIANVLCGKNNFTGKLPSPWYSSVEQIGSNNNLFEIGYGLSY